MELGIAVFRVFSFMFQSSTLQRALLHVLKRKSLERASPEVWQEPSEVMMLGGVNRMPNKGA